MVGRSVRQRQLLDSIRILVTPCWQVKTAYTKNQVTFSTVLKQAVARQCETIDENSQVIIANQAGLRCFDLKPSNIDQLLLKIRFLNFRYETASSRLLI